VRHLAALCAVVVTAGGCGTVYQGVPGYDVALPAAYAKALSAHTRAARSYTNLVQRALVVATLETPDFLEARFSEDARIHDLPEAERAARLEAFRKQNPGITAVIFLDASRPSWQDLSAKDSIWRVALEVSGKSYDAASVEKLDERNATLRHLFPYASRYGRLYLVRFPEGAEKAVGETSTLVVAGAPARVRLKFVPPT